MRPSPRSVAAQVLEPLHAVLWILFLIWTAIGAAVMPLELGPAQIREWIPYADLQVALVAFLEISDAIWIVLAAALAYLALAEHEGLATARRWSLFILAGSAALETVGAVTGLPFGPYVYTDRFGWRILGVLPFTIPLAWLTIVICGRYLVLLVRPRASRWQIALGTGLAAVLTDLNLEPIAWKVRAYWLWYPTQSGAPSHPPLQNYVSWFVAATLLALAFPRRAVETGQKPDPRRPVLILSLMNALFLLVHAVRYFRNA